MNARPLLALWRYGRFEPGLRPKVLRLLCQWFVAYARDRFWLWYFRLTRSARKRFYRNWLRVEYYRQFVWPLDVVIAKQLAVKVITKLCGKRAGRYVFMRIV